MDNVNGISSIYTSKKHIPFSIDSLAWDKEFISICIKNLAEPFALAHVTSYKFESYVVVKPFHSLFFILRITECQLKTTDLPLGFRQSRWQRWQRLQWFDTFSKHLFKDRLANADEKESFTIDEFGDTSEGQCGVCGPENIWELVSKFIFKLYSFKFQP